MKKIFIALLSATLLAACAAPITKDTSSIQQVALASAKNTDLSPLQVLEETRDLQVEAQREYLYFYSPTYIAQAEQEIRLAEKALKDKLANQQIIAYALTGKQLLKRGLETKQLVLVQLKSSLDGLKMLTQLKADSLLAGDYEDIQGDIKDLIILIEQDKTASALKEQSDVLADIQQLEIKTLKKIHLSPVEHALDKADDSDAEDYASRSFAAAEKATERLEDFIEKNTQNRDAIQVQAKQALHIAQHAHHVSIAALPLLKLKPESAEQHILFIEKLLARIGTALKQGQINHLPLDSQSIALAQAAETLGKQGKSLEKQNQWGAEKTALEDKINMLQKQLVKLKNRHKTPAVEQTPIATNEKNSVTKINAEQLKVNVPAMTQEPAAPAKAQQETTTPTENSASDAEAIISENKTETLIATEKTEDTVEPNP